VRNAISSELLKLRTTRTFFGLLVGVALLVVAVSALVAVLNDWRPDDSPPGEDVISIATLAILFALVLGVLAVSTEFRHGTITPTLLAVPSRARLVAAKLVAHLLGGLLLGFACVAVSAAIVEPILSARGIESGTSTGDLVSWTLGTSVATGLYAALGVAVGAIVRNQVAGIVGVFAWLMMVEPVLAIVPALADPIERFGIGTLSEGIDGFVTSDTGDPLGQLPAGLVLVGYVVLALLAAVALLRRRDVTA
jgi:ABC-2 type transport system permease protein